MIEDVITVIDYSNKHFQFDGRMALVGHSQGFYISLFSVPKIKGVSALVSLMGRVSDIDEFFQGFGLKNLRERSICFMTIL